MVVPSGWLRVSMDNQFNAMGWFHFTHTEWSKGWRPYKVILQDKTIEEMCRSITTVKKVNKQKGVLLFERCNLELASNIWMQNRKGQPCAVMWQCLLHLFFFFPFLWSMSTWSGCPVAKIWIWNCKCLLSSKDYFYELLPKTALQLVRKLEKLD